MQQGQQGLSDQGYNPDLVTWAAKVLGSNSVGSNTSPDSHLFGNNPQFNVTDDSLINKGAEASDSWWRNSYEDFMQSYYTTQLNTIQGKAEAGDALMPMPWNKLEGPSAVVDNYPDRVAALKDDLTKGKVTQDEFTERMQSLDTDKQAAQEKMQEYNTDETRLRDKAAQYGVNKQFKLKQASINQQADAASIWDRAYYNAGNTTGSSASLMLPNFVATFGNKAAQNLLKVGIANLIPGIGEAADVAATAGALVGTVGEAIWSRGQETYGEIMQPVQDARDKLTKDYMEAHSLSDASQIPEEEMRRIRIQSRQGVEQQFRENMFLATTDIAQAVLMPFSNVGYGIGKYADRLGKVLGATEHLAEEAASYGKWAKAASRLGKLYVESQGEGFEEGVQQAAQGRADEANKSAMSKDQLAKYNTWSNTMNFALQDGFDTASSIDIIPGFKSSLGGKYADDPNFQSSVFGGQFLGGLMAGPLTALAMGKDMQRFKAANADLIKSGVVDADEKFQQLRNSVLEKYFKNGRVEYLAGALKDLKGAKDDDGNPLMDHSDIDQTAKSIKEAYELYQDINDHVDSRVGGDKAFGLFDTRALSNAKDKLRSDIFNAATAITMHEGTAADISSQILAQKSKDGRFMLSNDEAAQRRVELEGQIEAAQKSLEAHERKTDSTIYYGAFWSSRLENHIEYLKNKISSAADELKQLNTEQASDKSTSPSAALVDLQQQHMASEMNLSDAKIKYAELSNIRTKAQLKDYVAKNANRPVPANSPLAEAPTFDPQDIADKISSGDVLTPEEADFKRKNAATVADILRQQSTSITAPAPVVAPIATATQSARPSNPSPPPTETPTQPIDSDPTHENIRKAWQKEFTGILDSQDSPKVAGDKLMDGLSKMYNMEPGATLSFPDVYHEFRDYVYADNRGLLAKNFDKLQTIMKAIAPSKDNYVLDNTSMEMSVEREESPVPSVQAGGWADDLNGKLNEAIREAQWEPGTGNKILNGLSIAQLNTRNQSLHFIDGKIQGDYRDDQGSLDYSEQHDQQLNNTNIVSLGDELRLSLDPGTFNFNADAKKQVVERRREAELEKLRPSTKAKTNEEVANADKIESERQHQIAIVNERYDAELAALDKASIQGIDTTIDTDANYDQAVIGIYKTIDQKVGANTVSKTVRLGSLHRIAKLRELIAPGVDLENEAAKLRMLRRSVIQDGEQRSTVATKGFGYLNTRSEKTTLSNAFGKDTRPYLSVIDNTGRPITTRNTKSVEIQGLGLKAGAAVIMMPNNGVYVPIYVTKNTLSTDHTIQDAVVDSVSKYLSDGAKKHLNLEGKNGVFGAEAYVYVTENQKTLAQMTPGSGMYIHDIKGVPAVTIGGNTFTADNSTGLREAIGSIYINVNRGLITGSNAAKYNQTLSKSNTITTNVQANPILLARHDNGEYGFLSNNEQYSYFSQHSVGLESQARVNAEPISEEQITEAPKDADNKADALLENLGLSLDFDDLYGADDLPGERSDMMKRLLVSPQIPASLQHQIVDSLAYMLFNNEVDKGVSNVDKIRQNMERFQKAFETKARTAEGEEQGKAQRAAESYGLLNEHFDELIARAKDVLDKLGIKLREEDDYYENYEEQGEDDGFAGFADDANSTRNQKDFLPSDIKKLLYFLPELAPLDMNREGDLKIVKETGKNYKIAKNSLGLDSFNNFNDTWEKLLGVTSGTYFSSTTEGFDAMLNKLKDPSNPSIVQEIAARVEKAPKQLQNAFFRNTYLQNQKNVTLMYNLKTISEYVGKVKEAFTKRSSFLIRSDRRFAEKKVLQDMLNEFKSNRSGILAVIDDPETGHDTYIINTDLTKEILAEARQIAEDQGSYKTFKSRKSGIERNEAGNYFTDEAKIALFNLVRRTGLNITFGAFKDALVYGNKSLSKATGERAIFKDLFLDKYFKTLAGNRDETAQGVPFERNNPFKHDSSMLEALALQEYKYRTMRRSGAFRMDGKSYFPYTRHNMLSELFLQLKEGSDFVLNKLKFDTFAKRSRVLNMINNPTENVVKPTISYELGARNTSSDNPAKLLKNMSQREHTIARLAAFQNDGKLPEFMYDTLSDKVTKPYIGGIGKLSVAGYTIGDKGRIQLNSDTMDSLMIYFNAEYDRIKQVEQENQLYNDKNKGQSWKALKNYHDILDKNGDVKKLGMGKFFHMYYFLNKAFLDTDNKVLSSLMYNADGSLKESSADSDKGIRAEINKHFNKVFVKNKQDFSALGLFDVGYDKEGNLKDDIQSFIDHKYLTRKYGILYNLGITPDKASTKKLNEGRYGEVLGPDILNKVINYAVVDYVVNSAMSSNEMLMLTGDPAQAGKPMSGKELKGLREKYKDQPELLAKNELLAHIMSTFVNLQKRNAAFLASGEKGMFDSGTYSVAIANDMSIASTHLEDYKRMFPDNLEGVERAYGSGDLTDAQEVTTVEEHLHVMKAFSKISEQTYRKALYSYDPQAYRMLFPGSGESISDEERGELAVVMQPQKPVQRTFNNEPGMSKQYYIKTSAYPLIPELIKGTPLEQLVNDMREKGVNRVAFVSGVKQGVAGSRDLFNVVEDSDGNSHEVYNDQFLTNNQNVLNRDGFRIQLEVPYKANKDYIREGTQQSKLMFVDIPHEVNVIFQNRDTKAGDVQKAYIEYHKRILDNQTKMLMQEIANTDGSINMQKLSNILQSEGEDRGYAMNSLLGLDLNERGQFKIPLTFLPNAGQMEPVITSILTNRIARLKMPGKSYVQGSEFMLRRGKVEQGKDLDKRGIIWTKPEYHNMNKLSYLHTDAEGNHHNSQIIMPFYFIKDGKKQRAEDFTKTLEDGRIVLDDSKIDPELLQMNGFRIPFQGHNSGMWFEIVGFLPEKAGDLILVPGEIAGQMGSDYDVDKLYSYMYNYQFKNEYDRLGVDAEDWERLKRLTNLKMVDLGMQKTEDGKYTREDYNSALAAVVEEEYADKGLSVPKHKVLKSGSDKYEIAKIHEDDPRSTEALQNAIIDAQKAIYTSADPSIMKAILDPLSFKDVQAAIDLLGTEGTSEFLGAFDPLYQRDSYFSNVTGKLATAICANANTSHAMAQSSNLFIKGQGVYMLDENGVPYSDRTGVGDDNRVNAYDAAHYQYLVKIGEGQKLVDQNDGANNTAWRLDKVNTFPDPVTGEVFRISNLISQLLGVSVDNAKEQLLGAFGINKENLNVVLTLVRTGFSLNVAKAFINQPILKEYYEAIGDAEDIFDLDYTSNKANKILSDLYQKYGKMADLDEIAVSNIISKPTIEGFKFSELRDNLNAEITPQNALMQLEAFKAYQRYKDISDGLATLTSTFGIDVKGLPKNMSETAAKAEAIENILQENPTLGGVPRYANNTIPGLFLGIPDLAVDLFMNPENPLFLYNSAAYVGSKNAIMLLTGKSQLYQDQLDTIHASIKQFLYSGFRFPDTTDIQDERKRLLFDTENSESMQTRLGKLQVLYPKNELLAAIAIENSTNPANPKLLSIESSNEDDYVQKIQEYWENMLNEQQHPDLQAFAYDMLKYAMWVQPQEFGNSNIVRYMPIIPMMNLGLSDYLNLANLAMADQPMSLEGYAPHVTEVFKTNEGLDGFPKQFLQHNLDFLLTAREDHFAHPAKDWVTRQQMVEDANGEANMRTFRVSLNQFTLPAIPTESRAFAKNRAASLVRGESYPTFLKFWTKEVEAQMYEGSENVDGTWTYYRVEKLGMTNVSEYNMAGDANTLVGDNLPSAEGRPVGPVRAAMRESGSTGFNEGKDYVTLNNTNDILGGLTTKMNATLSSLGHSKEERTQAEYFVYLSNYLQGAGLSDIRIILDDNLGVAGRTNPTGTVITFSPRYFKQLISGERKGRGGMTAELEKARTVLHEFIHAKMFQALHKGQGGVELKKIQEVHDAYKASMRTNEVIRGVNISALDAELFSALKEGFDRGSADLSNNFADFVSNTINNDVELRKYFNLVGQRLNKLSSEGKLADKNYDLVTDPARFNAFREHVQKAFADRQVTSLINKYYAYHSIDEFITEAMTNPKTQDILRGMPSVWKTFVDTLKDFFAKIFGVDTQERTLFDDALDSIYSFMKAATVKTLPEMVEELTEGMQAPRVLQNKLFETPMERQYITPQGKKITFNDQQFEALGGIKEWLDGDKGHFYTLSGYAGTGKTTLVNAAIRGRSSVAVTAPTHKAKSVVRKATAKPGVTIQSLLGLRPNVDIEDFNPSDPEFAQLQDPTISKYKIVVIDEASMLNAPLFEMIINEARKSGTKVLFMGDDAQLPPIGETKSLVFTSDLVTNRSALTKVERQANDNPLMSVYDGIRNNINSSTDAFAHRSEMLNGKGIMFYPEEAAFTDQLKATFTDPAYDQDRNYAKMLAYRNASVTHWNQIIRGFIYGENTTPIMQGESLMAYNNVGKDIINSADYRVRNVIDTINNYGIRVFRVMLEDVDEGKTTTKDIVHPEDTNKAGALIVPVLQEAKRTGKWGSYYGMKESMLLMQPYGDPRRGGIKKDIDYGYALTVHKSQGSTYTYAFVDENDIDSRDNAPERNRLKYVAFSRPTDVVYSLSRKAEGNVVSSPVTGVDDITADGIISDLIERGLVKTKC